MHYFCDRTALEIWRALPPGIARRLEQMHAEWLLDPETKAKAIRNPPAFMPFRLSLPMHIQTDDSHRSSSSKKTVFHSWGDNPVPPGSFFLLDCDSALASPELCLTQLAAHRDRTECLLAAAELFGTYRIGPGGRAIFDEPILSDRSSVESYLENLHSMKGRGTLGRLLRWIPENSASPRESILYYLLCLPSKMGGHQLPAPEMNHPIAFTGLASDLTGHRHARCDLFWPSVGLAVEYDSFENHNLTRRQDMSRREALELMGVKMVTITREDLRDFQRFDMLVRAIRKHLGMRAARPGDVVVSKRMHLHDSLVSSWQRDGSFRS